MYDLKKIIRITEKYENELIEHFEDFFKELVKNDKINIKDTKVKIKKLIKYEDINELPNNPGFYIILTDYMLKHNNCIFRYNFNGNEYVKAVYRGEADSRKDRLTGHLFKDEYKGNDTKFMTINNDNGININKEPYCNYNWFVLTCSMQGTNRQIRICAEKAFDLIFRKPMYSSR